MAVAAILLEEHAIDDEQVAEDAAAALGCGASAGDGGDVTGAFADGTEDVEFDGTLRAAVRWWA